MRFLSAGEQQNSTAACLRPPTSPSLAPNVALHTVLCMQCMVSRLLHILSFSLRSEGAVVFV
jgi:hypothetical protein